MHHKGQLELKQHHYFIERFQKKLKEPSCVIEPLGNLTGGWYLETFKQVTNKLTKNKSSPLPLFFPTPDSLESISKNRQLLKEIFKAFDTRGLGKIDACELYSILLTLSKGSYEIYLKTIVDIFGFQFPGRITKYQFFFFLDSLYRAMPKVLITKGYDKPIDTNIRLDYKDINKFIDKIFQNQNQLDRNQIYQTMMKQPQLNDFLKYLQKKCTTSAGYSRNLTIDNIKIQSEVRRCMTYILNQIDNYFKSNILEFSSIQK